MLAAKPTRTSNNYVKNLYACVVCIRNHRTGTETRRKRLCYKFTIFHERVAAFMRIQLSRALATLLMVLFSLSPAWATCGGGGGGGTGGVGGGNSAMGPAPTVYKVPLNIWDARTKPNKGLILYWFPASNAEIQRSPMKTSRILTLYSAQCVTMTVADAKTPELQPIIGDSALPVAVLASADGAPIKKIESTGGKLKIDEVEKTIEAEMKQRETALDAKLKDAKEK